MNIYSKKQRWKFILALTATVIVLASLWYTNVLVNQIAKEEQNKAKAWAKAIEQKAKLVDFTKQLFEKISVEERKKVEIWAKANRLFIDAPVNEDVTIYLEILASNRTIPTIIVDEKGHVLQYSNLDSTASSDTSSIKALTKEFELINKPIEINYAKDKSNFLYYGESKIFTELRNVLNDQIQSFNSDIITNSASVPVIYTDSEAELIAYGNLDSSLMSSKSYVDKVIEEMKLTNTPIKVPLGENKTGFIYYNDSPLLVKLKYYPFVQLAVIGLFLLIAYYLFSTARKAEQNQVWVGMAKETAHQLGTPLSSLLAWIEVLKSRNVDEKTIAEISNDLGRLETVTERFSKIGAAPNLETKDVNEVIKKTLIYLKTRLSKKVKFQHTTSNGAEVNASINVPLLEWVLENIIKNGVDAIAGDGEINIHVTDQSQFVYIDISDDGKGIPKSARKTVFQPGFTTKKRGWGLGLSLTKRIIENYHSGKVFVKQSEIGKGTTFRIVLNKVTQNGRNIHSYSFL